jgi:trans-aconitate 2-methyltransferase
VNARYTYGDGEVAATRLELVADAFEPTTRAFLQRAVVAAPRLALDLGCGPGRTTRLIREVTGATRAVGMDRSESFLQIARRGAPDGVSFRVHDVTIVPMPEGPADLIFSRLLVAHLPEPEAVVTRWSTWLTLRGSLLVDELESIEAPDGATRDYLDEVAIPVVRTQGAELLAGPILHAMADPKGTERVHDDVVDFTPAANVSARIFAMNLGVLVGRGEVSPRPDLSDALGAAAEGRRHAPPTTWRLRQIAWRRVAPVP